MSAPETLSWDAALDRLELELVHAERLLADPASSAHDREPWDAPVLEGPMPAALAERAIAIRARQRATESALAAALGAARRQHRFADRVDRATARVEPAVYVDLEA